MKETEPLPPNPFVEVIRKQLDSDHKDDLKHRLEVIIKKKEDLIKEENQEVTKPIPKKTEMTEDKSNSESPKIMPYSHKITTKLRFQDKSPKVWLKMSVI